MNQKSNKEFYQQCIIPLLIGVIVLGFFFAVIFPILPQILQVLFVGTFCLMTLGMVIITTKIFK